LRSSPAWSSDPPCNAEQIARLRYHGLAYYTGLEQYLGHTELADGCVVALANLEPALCVAALGASDPTVKIQIEHLMQEHQLFAADWYRHVKKALKARGIIESDAIVLEVTAGCS
jgi:4-hydroxy-tetrahydrodipicolinate synthase